MERVVLAVDRQELGSRPLRRTRHELARYDQSLLIGQRYAASFFERVIRGKQTECADHCSDDNLGAVTRCDLNKPVNADTDRRTSDDFSCVQLVPKSISTLFVETETSFGCTGQLIGEKNVRRRQSATRRMYRANR